MLFVIFSAVILFAQMALAARLSPTLPAEGEQYDYR